MMGATCLHGPHQSAQKSTSTGLSDLRTTSSKVASVTSVTVLMCCSSSVRAGWIADLLEQNPRQTWIVLQKAGSDGDGLGQGGLDLGGVVQVGQVALGVQGGGTTRA